MSDATSNVHGTAVALGEYGVLILGPSGSGKSDLALRLIDRGAVLVADDRVIITSSGAALSATAPEETRGLLEIRGMGIVQFPFLAERALHMVVQIKTSVERYPMDRQLWTHLDIALPIMHLSALEPSAPIKVEIFARQLKANGMLD
jgi:serine kinase of HPr protein (carbohydrate metabolism regulator)